MFNDRNTHTSTGKRVPHRSDYPNSVRSSTMPPYTFLPHEMGPIRGYDIAHWTNGKNNADNSVNGRPFDPQTQCHDRSGPGHYGGAAKSGFGRRQVKNEPTAGSPWGECIDHPGMNTVDIRNKFFSGRRAPNKTIEEVSAEDTFFDRDAHIFANSYALYSANNQPADSSYEHILHDSFLSYDGDEFTDEWDEDVPRINVIGGRGNGQIQHDILHGYARTGVQVTESSLSAPYATRKVEKDSRNYSGETPRFPRNQGGAGQSHIPARQRHRRAPGALQGRGESREVQRTHLPDYSVPAVDSMTGGYTPSMQPSRQNGRRTPPPHRSVVPPVNNYARPNPVGGRKVEAVDVVQSGRHDTSKTKLEGMPCGHNERFASETVGDVSVDLSKDDREVEEKVGGSDLHAPSSKLVAITSFEASSGNGVTRKSSCCCGSKGGNKKRPEGSRERKKLEKEIKRLVKLEQKERVEIERWERDRKVVENARKEWKKLMKAGRGC
ncbi:hypothetical protein ERJ75_001030400 [Trypanosoma vivax]|uniref:Uncharacterized protein n=1 Tax=Trypanosoma vivax (strain Y486) TaxID=1055687 RepID=G0TR77_TRYVY|nr:hypothetical protein TRVL_02663 [Trypanosoma vivax]KAH8611531.1 hypothetical protein ERJ75_001030400 [Trypanosoma vivax]CCC46441.1 conserved hypothetical protein [Trypanosoma vivax Y486]